MQDWIIDPDFPRTWHLDASRAGAGTLFDLGSHAVDLALFLVGDVDNVMSMHKTFIKERPLPGKNAATFSKGEGSGEKVMAKVDVDDAASMLMTFKNGAMGSIDLSRFATGRKNHNDFELYGSKGAIAFNFERMNELEFLDATQPLAEQGYRRILCTEGEHPYLSAWWPCGHPIGYEHTFVNAFYDFLVAIDEGTGIHPNFHDGATIMRVLEASNMSARSGRVVSVDEVV